MFELMSCPTCKNSILIYKNSSFECDNCNVKYDIVNGIPILLPKNVGTN